MRGTGGHNHSTVRLTKKAAAGEARHTELTLLGHPMGSERPEVLLKRGLDALVQALGRPDALRFLQTFKSDALLQALDFKDGPLATDSTESQPQYDALGGAPTQENVASPF